MVNDNILLSTSKLSSITTGIIIRSLARRFGWTPMRKINRTASGTLWFAGWLQSRVSDFTRELPVHIVKLGFEE